MITNTLNHFNLQLKTFVEGSIIVYTSSQVVSRVLCRDHYQQEAGGQEEHLGDELSVEVHKVFQVKSWLTLCPFEDYTSSPCLGSGYKVACSDFWPGFSRSWRERLDVELHQRLIVMPVTF